MKAHFINGQFTPGHSRTEIVVHNPATEDVLDMARSERRPTVLVNVDHSMKIMTEETFGPAIPLMTYASFEQAIALTNDSIYGLGACLYTRDAKKARLFFEEVKAGTIWINDPLTDNYAGPFGGMKYTGGARELGEEGLDEFRETKHVHWDIEGKPKEWWYPYHR